MSIDYTLAKELRDAGFPQKGEFGYRIDDKAPERFYLGNPYLIKDDAWVICPTLSELIEACGPSFSALNRLADGWRARSDKHFSVGSTPEEAVARLWLALHKK